MPLEQARIWMGKSDQLAVGVAETHYLTLTKGEISSLKGLISLNGNLQAPIEKNDVVGKVIYQVGDRSVGEVPLVALESVDKGSWFKRMIDSLKRLWVSWF